MLLADPATHPSSDSGLLKHLDIECFPAGCMHRRLIYDDKGIIERKQMADPTFVLSVTDLMKHHDKTAMLYVAEWHAGSDHLRDIVSLSNNEGGVGHFLDRPSRPDATLSVTNSNRWMIVVKLVALR